METRHILLCGSRGMGKSTLAARLLEAAPRPVGGYITRSTPRSENGFHGIYIYPAADTRRERGEANHIGECNGRERAVRSEVFDTLGVEYIRRGGGVLLMDEIGFMEADAPLFQREVLRALDGDTPVLACVRAVFDLPFLDAVRRHPRAAAYDVTPENRAALYEALLPVVKGWAREG